MYIKLVKDGLCDKIVAKVGAKQMKVIGMFDFACLPLRDGVRKFRSEAEAFKALRRADWIDDDGNLCEDLTVKGFSSWCVVDGNGMQV